MGKTKPKKTRLKPNFSAKFEEQTLKELAELGKSMRKSKTQTVASLISGEGVFSAEVERYIKQEARRRNLTWVEAVGALMNEAFVLWQLHGRASGEKPS